MITENITEEFIDKHYFVLDKPYSVEEYDCNGFPISRYLDIACGTEWEITDDSYIGGEIHLDGLSDGCGWLEIPSEEFREYFSAHEWERRNNKQIENPF